MKISFIATVFNESENILKLLDSLLIQSQYPDEIVIVDGGSTDNTMSVISNFSIRQAQDNQFKFSNKHIPQIKLITKVGNRSVGRNEAIEKATGDIIVCSDAGCILDKDWIKNIIKPFDNKNVDVVSGYYKGKPENIFQKCLVPYVLVMPDQVDPERFLPATRSMAFKKKIWEKIGGFPERFSNNEDFVFSKKLKKLNAKIVFEKSALVYWIPRKNLSDAFIMFFKFALGDAEARIFRSKVGLIFLRYILGILVLIFAIIRGELFLIEVLLSVIAVYVLWAIIKNYKYVKNIKALAILPVLQMTSDIAVISGTIFGLIKYGLQK